MGEEARCRRQWQGQPRQDTVNRHSIPSQYNILPLISYSRGYAITLRYDVLRGHYLIYEYCFLHAALMILIAPLRYNTL